MLVDHIHVEIEATNTCNTRCLHCPHEALSRPYGKMDWDTYQIIMDKVMAYTSHISVEYAGMGEPLLNPLIYQFVEYVSGKATTSLTTNLSALTPRNSQRLIDAGLHHLSVSFNGDEKELYELTMGGLDFGRAQRNLRAAVELSKSARTEIAANISVIKQTESRLAGIKTFLEAAGVEKVIFSKCHNRGGFLKDQSVCSTPPPPLGQYRCDIFTNTMFVSWPGKVLSCCHDLAGANIIGDFTTESIESLRQKKEDIAAEGVKFDICGGCNDLYRFMDDQVLGGQQISDWIYNLHAGDHENGSGELSPLVDWIFDIYAQEEKSKGLFANLFSQIMEKDQVIQSLHTKRLQEFQSLNARLDEIETSRIWRFVQSIQRIRLFFIPLGSHRERLFQGLLKRFYREV